MKTIYINIKQLCGVREDYSKPLRGKELNNLPSIENAYIICEENVISSYGKMDELDKNFLAENENKTVDVKNKIVIPAFVDSHTHIVFAEWREKEFVNRIEGLSYEEIAKRGGGILNSAEKLATKTEDELYNSAYERLLKCIAWGTGAIEIKSGYGLSVESEIKMLRVIKRLKQSSPIPVKSTFLGAHAIPAIYKENRKKYIDLLVEEMLPQIFNEQLADYIDVFCDRGFFTVEETDYILNAGAKYNLKPKIHANELGITGGVQVGVKHNAISVDHLEHTSTDEINCLKNSNTIPTLLPSTAFFLGIPYPDARTMIDNELSVVIASDYNPGSSPSGRMSFVISLACLRMKMLPNEAINAATFNASFALELQNNIGSISKNKLANFLICKDIPSADYIAYSFGEDAIENVVLNGKKL